MEIDKKIDLLKKALSKYDGFTMVQIKIPLIYLIQLVQEKEGWVKENIERQEIPEPFEQWLAENIPKQIKEQLKI